MFGYSLYAVNTSGKSQKQAVKLNLQIPDFRRANRIFDIKIHKSQDIKKLNRTG